MAVTKEIVSDEKHKPVLNEEILAKLLEAAWVLQEHNRAQQKVDLSLELHSEQLREQEQTTRTSASASLSASAAPSSEAGPGDYTSTLAKIVETQHQIQLRQLDFESSMAMVLERLIDITQGSGAAVGVIDGKKVKYSAATGSGSLPLATEVEKERALCFDCLRTGQVTRCSDVTSEFLLDVEECRNRGIQSLIAVPVYHDGGVAGALELYFSSANAFREADVHSCQLMAGLVTEALARDEEVTWKKSLAEERSVMLEALEKIKPNLAALAGETRANGVDSAESEDTVCRSCGADLVTGEQYCGTCGSPRTAAEQTLNLQSKLGSFLKALPAEKDKESAADYQHHDPFSPSARPSLPPEAGASSLKDSESAPQFLELEKSGTSAQSLAPKDTDPKPELAVTAMTPEGATWTSAAKAKDFLEQLSTAHNESAFGRFWSARRGDIYLAVAVILVAIVVRWGIWSEHSVSATGMQGTSGTVQRQQPDPASELSLFDKMLISMGLADPPEAPQDKGNPYTQVWVDLHTALYYCPGADLYGKTPKGRYASQRDAQLDQFEPAYRKNCD